MTIHSIIILSCIHIVSGEGEQFSRMFTWAFLNILRRWYRGILVMMKCIINFLTV